jgi:hypothetical protein
MSFIKVKDKYRIEKRRNKPNEISFQFENKIGFFTPKFIYIAFSEDLKTEFKAHSRADLIIWISRNPSIKLKKNEKSNKI